jgi:hypothetical protein
MSLPAASCYALDIGVVGLSKIQGIPDIAHDARYSTTCTFYPGYGVVRFWFMVSTLGLRELGLARIAILTHPDDHRSTGVAERSGFHREGLLGSYREKQGEREDRLIFSLIREDG